MSKQSLYPRLPQIFATRFWTEISIQKKSIKLQDLPDGLVVRIPRSHRDVHHPSRHLSSRHLKKPPIGLTFILLLHYNLISVHTKSQSGGAFHLGGGGEWAKWRLG